MRKLLLGLLLLLPAAASAQIGLPAGIAQSWQVVASGGTPAIDGTVAGSTGSVNSIVVNLTTTQSNDILIAYIEANLNGGDTTVNTVTDTSGLTWARRATNLDGAQVFEEWWAQAPAPLASDAITITFVHAATFISVGAFGVSGTTFASPFDTNAGLPFKGTFNDPVFSTTASNTFVISGMRFSATSTPTSGAGWTQVVSNAFLLAQVKSFTSPQTNTTSTVGTGSGDENGWVADALVP